jgi:hypothetical protein
VQPASSSCESTTSWAPLWPPRRFAVKSMPKRFAPGGHLESYYVRRVRNEVDICNHLGRCVPAWQQGWCWCRWIFSAINRQCQRSLSCRAS